MGGEESELAEEKLPASRWSLSPFLEQKSRVSHSSVSWSPVGLSPQKLHNVMISEK